MPQTLRTEVVIVGGGPVGLSGALYLAAQGVKSVVIDDRPFGQLPSVKSNHVSARSMERFRELGLAGDIRRAGLPVDYPHDVSFRTRLVGQELTRIVIPASRDRFTAREGVDVDWATPEPPHRINQTFLEPLLRERVASNPWIEFLDQTRFTSYEQTDDGIIALGRNKGGEALEVWGHYLIGCDGAKSSVRKCIGAKLHGDPVIQHVQSTAVFAPHLYDHAPGSPAWGYYISNADRSGHIYAIDGRGTFLVHNHLSQDEFDNETVDRHWSIRQILGVGEDFEYEVVSQEDWVARRLVAERFRDGRAFIAGDAAHIWVPYAGYGMNAGIADVLNLSWLLAARIAGWGLTGILDAYEAERLPITDQVSRFAMNHAQQVTGARSVLPENIEGEGEDADMARQGYSDEVYALNVQQFAAEGLNFGYNYSKSPIISYDGSSAPAYSMGEYSPSTVPGCRLPHAWLNRGSLYDDLGSGYTLLVRDSNTNVAPLVEAAVEAGVPLKVVQLGKDYLRNDVGWNLLICRPDQHVAWRGLGLPSCPSALVDLLAGGVSYSVGP